MVNPLYSMRYKYPIMLLLLQVYQKENFSCRVVTYVVARHVVKWFAWCSLYVSFWESTSAVCLSVLTLRAVWVQWFTTHIPWASHELARAEYNSGMQLNLQNAGLVNVERTPDSCPVCLQGILPIETGVGIFASALLERVLRCPRQECGHLFISRYRPDRNTGSFQLIESVPLTIRVSDKSDIVKAVSPDFVNIFAEAERAEQIGLRLVCGPGYRKALEFLIKDYVIRPHTDKAEEIKRLQLGACINNYVSDAKVKQVAARAVWLGNDETHYLRKWEEKDLTDLKLLINLTVHWIEMDELTQKALSDMPEGKT